MALSESDYLSQLQELLPPGIAWPRDPDSLLAKHLSGFAAELARIDARAERLVMESDPRETNELLTDFERMCGLPDPCAASVADEITTAERRGAVLALLTGVGGQSAAYFVWLAESFGYTIKVVEFRLHDVNCTVDDALYSDPWQYAWQVDAPAVRVAHFTVFDTVSDPLAWWGNVLLECLIRRYKPAHTTVIFAYRGT
jgi:uncharacterized protein YmfQ (DUF2313 family)